MTDLQELQDLENLKVEDVEKPLQKMKIKKGEKPVTEDAVSIKDATVGKALEATVGKKPRTEKQLEAFAKAREKMMLNLKERKEKKALEDAERKKEIEEKIVKKALAIKKKQIKAKAIIESISDDDTPIEEVKKIATKIAVSKGKALEPEPPKTLWEKYKFL
jgi:hypothetical protein